MFSGFSWEPVYVLFRLCMHALYFQVRLSGRICLPQSTSTPFNQLFRQLAVLSLLRLHITHMISMGILTHSAIACAVRLPLRTRLTLIRLALIRKPWSFGEGFLTPFIVTYTYICFSNKSNPNHLRIFFSVRMLPYRCINIPQLRYTAYARLLSMPKSSTSELLRTL